MLKTTIKVSPPEQFKEWRLNANLSQVDVAKALKFDTPQMISNIERGISTYPISHFKTVASLFNVTVRDIKIQVYFFKEKKIREELGL